MDRRHLIALSVFVTALSIPRVHAAKMYWADGGTDEIERANLDARP